MEHRPTTVERAYDLARSGEFSTVGAIKDRLKREGYSDIAGQLYGPTIQRALRDLCSQAQQQRASEDAPHA